MLGVWSVDGGLLPLHGLDVVFDGIQGDGRHVGADPFTLPPVALGGVPGAYLGVYVAVMFGTDPSEKVYGWQCYT